MADNKISLVFYHTEAGNEPAREWLKDLPPPSADAQKIRLEPRKQYDNNRRKPSRGPNRGGSYRLF